VPQLTNTQYITADDVPLTLRRWSVPDDVRRAIVIGVHGFNDYGNFLMPEMPAFLQSQGIEVLSYDQRGFGDSETRGRWAGHETYQWDLLTFISLVKQANPHVPLFVFGESMGGAISLTTLARWHDLPIEGVILSAPAVWGRTTWPWYQKLALSLMARIAPQLALSGGGFVQPTDNEAAWQAWSNDPLVIRKTRVASLWGVSTLMDEAFAATQGLSYRTLILYGAQDQVIPLAPVQQFIAAYEGDYQFAFYPEGWHMLPRDHNGPTVWRDVVAWMADPDKPLPSGADQGAYGRLQNHQMQ